LFYFFLHQTKKSDWPKIIKLDYREILNSLYLHRIIFISSRDFFFIFFTLIIISGKIFFMSDHIYKLNIIHNLKISFGRCNAYKWNEHFFSTTITEKCTRLIKHFVLHVFNGILPGTYNYLHCINKYMYILCIIWL